MEELYWKMVCYHPNYKYITNLSNGSSWPNFRAPWLTFVRNRGELAEGWYDPATLQKSLDKPAPNSRSPKNQRRDLPSRNAKRSAPPADSKAEESSDDEIGPALPSQDARISRAGPAIPRMEDLELRDGMTVFVLCTDVCVLIHSNRIMR